MPQNKFIAHAKSFLGCSESDGSHRKIIDLYNQISPLPRGYRMGYSDPWCAAFVSAVGRDFGVVLPECSCPKMIEKYKAAGKWQPKGYSPKAGDIVFYDWNGDNCSDHVGIVCEVEGSRLKIIEGNISNSVAYRSIDTDYPHIIGYATPFVVAAYRQTEGLSVELSLPRLSTGTTGNSVKALQLLLIGNGCSCGKYGADGDFGIDTATALKAYQKQKNLNPDAIAGKQTWSALLL